VDEEHENKPTLFAIDSHTVLPYTNIMQWGMHSVIETDQFLRDAKAIRLTDEERDEIVGFIAANPQAGDEIRGTGGARKIRWAGKGKGKRGGYRVFTFYSGDDIPVFLLRIISKNRLYPDWSCSVLTDRSSCELAPCEPG